MRLLILSLCLLSFAACKKENSTTTYTLLEANNSKVHGTVEVKAQGNKSAVYFRIISDTANRRFDAHFHEGPPNGYKGFAPYAFMNFGAVGNLAELRDTIDIKYADFLLFDATAVVHLAGQSPVLAKGGVGKNK